MSQLNAQLLKKLAGKWLDGTILPGELELLDKWYNQQSPEEIEWGSMDKNELELKNRLFDHIQESADVSVDTHRIGKRTRFFSLWPKVAAAILIAAGIGAWFFNAPRHPSEGREFTQSDIKPGTNKAILTLSDGSTITLTDAANGALAKQSGVQITKTANGQLIYEVSSSNLPASLAPPGRGGEAGEGENHSNNSSLPSGISPQRGERGVALNTISTPRGGQYQVRLPDGSKVWLNAASKLSYPVTFSGQKDRKVRLVGEGYFEVAKDKTHPFIVTTDRQDVEVLGTHFNINGYEEEGSIKTTLLEGSVKILAYASPNLSSGPKGETIVLKPNEEADLGQFNRIMVKQVDANEAIAWKNGRFAFSSEALGTIMRKVSRWYDVEIIYKAPIQDLKVTGSVSRYDQVSKLLDILETTGGVKFKIEGKKIMVSQ